MSTAPTFKFPWATVAIVAIGAIILFFVFKGCRSNPSHALEKKQNDSIIYRENRADATLRPRLDLLAHYNDSIVKVNSILKQQVEVTKVKLHSSENEIIDRINKISLDKITITDGEKSQTGPVMGGINGQCDSLAIAALTQVKYSRQLEDQNNQLQSGYELQLSYKDSTAAALLNGYNNLRASFDTVGRNYNHLYSDYTKSGRKVNFQKWEIRGLAAIAIVEAVKIVVFKK
jgi:hypothetical protein